MGEQSSLLRSEDYLAADRFKELWQTVKKLRSPEGCPWDREQDFASMKNQFLDEVYEFVDALEENDSEAMSEELGDLFFHLLFFSCLGEDGECFSLESTLGQIKSKLIRRHPHVFLEAEGNDISPEEVKVNWERIKREVEGKEYKSALDSVPASLPPLLKAFVLGQKASKVGFDWSTPAEILPKLREELAEVEEVLEIGGERLEEELGDLLFVVVNLVRLSGFEPGRVLNRANLKFSKRFRFMEQAAQNQSTTLASLTLEKQEILWQMAKVKEEEMLGIEKNQVGELTSASFAEMISNSDLPVVVNFWTSWCGHCRNFEPVFAEAAEKLKSKATLFRVETEEEPELVRELAMMTTPTQVVFRGGKEVARQTGVLQLPLLMEWLKPHLN